MRLSFIIPFYNGKNTIEKSIDSIYAIGLGNNDFELWKTDDYSLFYEHLGKDILAELNKMNWNQPVRGMIAHPRLASYVLSIIGPILKSINFIRHKI